MTSTRKELELATKEAYLSVHNYQQKIFEYIKSNDTMSNPEAFHVNGLFYIIHEALKTMCWLLEHYKTEP